MAQTELMLRLLQNNKIVGYALIHQFPEMDKENDPAECWMLFSKTGNFEEEYYNHGLEHFITYDSFELGIKIDGRWLFEGDIIESGDTKHDLAGSRWYLAFDSYFRCWMQMLLKDEEDTKEGVLFTEEKFCKVGTIHDTPKGKK